MSIEIGRWLAASGLLLAYILFTYCQFRQSRGARCWLPRLGRHAKKATGQGPIWLIYASQSGQSEAIARQTAQILSSDTQDVYLSRIDENWLAEITDARCVLFVVSTYGEGSAPDHALRFVRQVMAKGPMPACQGMRYGMLALGGRSYPAYCAFGRQLDAWLQASGAVPEFARIEVNQLDQSALQSWRQSISVWAGAAAASWSALAPDYATWRVIERRCLNTGSSGGLVFLLSLQATDTAPVTWQAGDLADVLVPNSDGLARAYSIANLPSDGRIELIVRQHVRPDGSLGLASGWLTEHAAIGDNAALRVRKHASFHLAHDALNPLILIGTGVGLAGLRAHVQARAKAVQDSGQPAPQRNAWLIFGERSSQYDHLCQADLEAWQRTQILSKLDLCFSRDQSLTPYVQHRLLAESKALVEWVQQGAHILICGNAQTMAPAVDQALREILGSEQVDKLFEVGRIQRDVF